jgi:hypothetical protein
LNIASTKALHFRWQGPGDFSMVCGADDLLLSDGFLRARQCCADGRLGALGAALWGTSKRGMGEKPPIFQKSCGDLGKNSGWKMLDIDFFPKTHGNSRKILCVLHDWKTQNLSEFTGI